MQKLRVLILFLLCSASIAAQNEVKANEFFQAANYAEAQTEYGLLLKRQPSSALYLYRYARCAQELGDYATAIAYFEKSGNRYDLKHFNLGEIYMQLGYPEHAIASYEAYLNKLKPDSERIPYIQAQIRYAEKLQRYMRRVEKVEIIDSVETSVDSLLIYCPLSTEAGTITRSQSGCFVYTNQRNDRKLWSTNSDSASLIVSSHSLMGQWSKPDTLPTEVNMATKQISPYVLSDGLTLYFASCDTSGLGGYDIYVTRYNTYTEAYTTPENVGMPFNSKANDYLMLIDENRNIGYWATDRFSPEGKARIYSFVPTTQKSYWRNLSEDSLVAYAQLRYTIAASEIQAIATTDTLSANVPAQEEEHGEIFFILNDSVVYTSLKDFQHPKALSQYQEWEQIQHQIDSTQLQLSNLRFQYSQSDEIEQKKLAPAILQLEQLQSQYIAQCDKLIYYCRKLEITARQQ